MKLLRLAKHPDELAAAARMAQHSHSHRHELAGHVRSQKVARMAARSRRAPPHHSRIAARRRSIARALRDGAAIVAHVLPLRDPAYPFVTDHGTLFTLFVVGLVGLWSDNIVCGRILVASGPVVVANAC